MSPVRGTSSVSAAVPMRAVEPSVLVGFVCAVGLLLSVALLNAWNIQRVYRASSAVAHTYVVHASLEQLLATLGDAETGQRGFIITGASRYLEPYQAAKDRVKVRIEEVRAI